MSRTLRTLLLLVAASVASSACATATDGETFRPRADPMVITEAEISAVGAANLYDVVRELRPRWMQSRGVQSFGGATVIGVYRGQTYLGDVESLRNELPGSVARLRWLDGATATASLRAPAPGVHLAGAIVLDPRG
jgi:hypothetical protein